MPLRRTDFHVKTIAIDSDEGPIRAKLQIWDTGGQERFSSIRPMYYRGSLGALLIFDLTNSDSFEHLPQWIEEVRANVKSEIPLLLVGNKSDLVDQKAVSLDEINHFTRNFNLYYMETSAKTGEGVGDCFYILACLMIGSGVPDQLITKGIVFSPGMIPITGTEVYAPSIRPSEPELEYAAPPVPEPVSTRSYESSSTFEPEPEFEFEAPPVPEPDIPLPDAKAEDITKTPAAFTFKTPEEILASEKPSQPTPLYPKDDTYKPKAAPFTSNVPVPAPTPEGFQSSRGTPSIESTPSSNVPFIMPKDSSEPKSDSLVDYLPEPIYSKKEKKKLEKQKKKQEKEKKLQEEKEKQEKLLQEMKKSKKDKKEKPKKDKGEKEKVIVLTPPPTRLIAEETSTSSLFQTLTQKSDETEKASVTAFMPFTAKKGTEPEQTSKLRIIPNVSDLESQPSQFSGTQSKPSIQSDTQKRARKEIIICKQCGAILSSDYAFCNKCGSKL
ncbi:MAG: GTP-binding protein [Promethearchaeota archaeon]